MNQIKNDYIEKHDITTKQIETWTHELLFNLFSLLVKGMAIIEQLDPMSFTNYLKKYRNTICGRHPIGVLLNVSTTE